MESRTLISDLQEGARSDIKKYRTISIIPVMAKVFSVVLYGRPEEGVEQQLREEQYGFRSGRGCDDAPHVVRQVVDRSNEWGGTALDGHPRRGKSFRQGTP